MVASTDKYVISFVKKTINKSKGNDMIHYLTTQADYSLQIDMTDWQGVEKVAIYKHFKLKSESDGYRISISGYHSKSNAGDSLSSHYGKKFSTYDVDNDDLPIQLWNGNCAKRFHGAWWYSMCYNSNLNGKYYTNGIVPKRANNGLAWNSWHGAKYSLKFVEMKIFRNFKAN